MRIYLLIAAASLLIAAQTYQVKWVGEMHKVMNGEDKAALSLDSFSSLPHFYALGPVAGLDGEITVIDSDPSIARIQNGKPVVEKTFHVDAPLLIYTQVAKWTEVALPPSIHTLADLDKFVGKRAHAAPFPFRVTAHCASVALHIVNRQGRQLKNHADAQVKEPLTDADIDLIGFWSDKHQGILTHMGSNVHAHARTRDGKISGHVDDLEITSGKLLIPASN